MIKLYKEIKFSYYDIWMVFARSSLSIKYNPDSPGVNKDVLMKMSLEKISDWNWFWINPNYSETLPESVSEPMTEESYATLSWNKLSAKFEVAYDFRHPFAWDFHPRPHAR